MTKSEAQQILADYFEGWCNDVAPDFMKDSIEGGLDEEAQEALRLVGMDFDWYAKVAIYA